MQYSEGIIKPFCRYASKTREGNYYLKWAKGTCIYVKLVSIEDGDNNLEFNDTNYENFTVIIVRIRKLKSFNALDGFKSEWLKEGVLFEFSYHDFPDEFYNSKGELISK